MPDSILVVFTDQTDLWWLRVLRRGFRHCFVILRFADIWISVDALAHKTEVMRLDLPDAFDLRRWFESQGDHVISVPVPPLSVSPKCLLPAAFSCVENVKRVVGIQSCFILTPWQLFRHFQTILRKDI